MIDYTRGLYFGFSLTREDYERARDKNENLGGDFFLIFENFSDYFHISETIDDVFVGFPIYDVETETDCILSLNDINDLMNTEEFKHKADNFITFYRNHISPFVKSYCFPSVHLIKISW